MKTKDNDVDIIVPDSVITEVTDVDENEGKTKCQYCEEMIADDDINVFEYEGDTVTCCDTCKDEYYLTCGHCDELTHIDDSYSTPNDRQICSSCRDNSYFECEGCSEILLSNSCFHRDGTCHDCWNDRDSDDDSYMRPYKKDTTLLEFEQGSILTSQRAFGVELETYTEDEDNARNLEVDDRIGLEHDGSISADIGIGVEFQTPPACGKKAEDMIIALCDKLSNKNFMVNKSCGYHIHIDTADVTGNRSKTIGIFAFYIAFEDVIMSFLPKGRRNNGYCKGLRSDYHIQELYCTEDVDQIEKIWYRVRTEVDVKRCKDDKKHDSRYRGINMHTLFSQNNLEIRFHSGTINHQKILNWAILHQNIIDNAYNLYYCQDTFIKATNMVDLIEKTALFFSLLGIKTEVKDYFISRQRIFGSTERVNISLDTFKMTERIINNENEL